MLYFSIVGLFETILKLIAALFLMVTLSDKLTVYSYSLLLISIILLILKVSYVLNKYPETKINLFKYFNKPLFKQIASFSAWGFLTSTVSIFTSYGQNILVNIFFGTRINAAQSISGQVIGQVGSVTNVFLRSLNPIISKSVGSGNVLLFNQAIRSGSKLAFLSFSIIGIPIIFEMNYIFKLWLKEIPDFTILFCSISMIGFILGQLTISVESAIFATGKIKFFTIIKSITDIIPFLFIFLFFKMGYPPYSMYVIGLIFELIRQSIVLYFGKILCEIDVMDFILSNILKPLFISLIAILSILLIQFIFFPSVLRIVISFAFSSLVTILMYFFVGFSEKEISIFKSLYFSFREKINRFIVSLN
jgi:Na+-driven multidrug efflux pump